MITASNKFSRYLLFLKTYHQNMIYGVLIISSEGPWARAHGTGPMGPWDRAHGPRTLGPWGPGPWAPWDRDLGPMGSGPWAHGTGPMGPWDRDLGPMGPGPWAHGTGTLVGPGPWAPLTQPMRNAQRVFYISPLCVLDFLPECREFYALNIQIHDSLGPCHNNDPPNTGSLIIP